MPAQFESGMSLSSHAEVQRIFHSKFDKQVKHEQIIKAKTGKKRFSKEYMPCMPLYVPQEALDCQTAQEGKGRQ